MLEPHTLGQLLLMQSIVISLPDEKSIFSFICRGLLDMPGVFGARYSDTAQEQEDASTVRIPLLLGETCRGEMLITVEDPEAFAPYMDYVKNFCYMLAVILEERDQRRKNELFQSQLEERVKERTRQLEEQIAERLSIEESLRESEGRFRALVENLPVKVFIKDRESRYVVCNPSYAMDLGIDPEEIRGKTDYDFYSREMSEKYRADDITVMESGRGAETEEPYISGGQQMWVHTIKVPLRDAALNVTGILGVFWDITERKRAEEALAQKRLQLEELNRNLEQRVADAVLDSRKKDQVLILQGRQAAMGEMIGNISHQWRQPLNTLGLIVQELLMTYGREEFTRESLESSVRKAMGLISHMSRTIEDFSNYFKPDRVKVLFNVKQAVAKTLSLIEPSLEKLDIRVDLIEKEEAEIEGYPNEYSQVLLNILLNSRDAFEGRNIDRLRVITIAVFKESGRSVVTVADSAGGIPEDVMDKIFDPYFTTKGPDKGTGIGLYMAKAIIEKNMGGRLTVRNTEDGAEFRIEV
jgi:PAS domain S-box-containing protein